MYDKLYHSYEYGISATKHTNSSIAHQPILLKLDTGASKHYVRQSDSIILQNTRIPQTQSQFTYQTMQSSLAWIPACYLSLACLHVPNKRIYSPGPDKRIVIILWPVIQ